MCYPHLPFFRFTLKFETVERFVLPDVVRKVFVNVGREASVFANLEKEYELVVSTFHSSEKNAVMEPEMKRLWQALLNKQLTKESQALIVPPIRVYRCTYIRMSAYNV